MGRRYFLFLKGKTVAGLSATPESIVRRPCASFSLAFECSVPLIPKNPGKPVKTIRL